MTGWRYICVIYFLTKLAQKSKYSNFQNRQSEFSSMHTTEASRNLDNL